MMEQCNNTTTNDNILSKSPNKINTSETQFIVYTGSSRKAKVWNRKEYKLKDFINKLINPVVTDETFKEYLNLSKDDQEDLKDVGGYVAGELHNGRRNKNSVINRSMITLDADFIGSKENLGILLNRLWDFRCFALVHPSRKSEPDKPRYRIIIPLAYPLTPDEYEPAARMVCKKLGMDFFDPTTTQANRLMFWPSVSKDMEDCYNWYGNDGSFFDGKAFLGAEYTDYRDIKEWPRFKNETDEFLGANEKDDPTLKPGLIGAFCRTYSIDEAIAEFLPDVYEPTDEPGRYTYTAGSSYGGAVVYGNFLYSFHATDPANNGHSLNAYDLVKVHKFGEGKDAEEAMGRLAHSDPKCQDLRRNEFAEQQKKIPSKEEITNPNIRVEDRLEKHPKTGKNLDTRANIINILDYDPNLQNFYRDIFANRYVVNGDLPWNGLDITEETRLWTDDDDSGLRTYLEGVYDISNKDKAGDALAQTFAKRKVNPVKDWLESIEWDGIPRLETLLIDYFGAEDNAYTREAMKFTLVSQIDRTYYPGAKHDEMLILVGDQGIGKSTFVKRIAGKPEWYSDTKLRFDNKDAMANLQGIRFYEIGELSGFKYSTMEDIKCFLSSPVDEFREAYQHRKNRFPRTCVFIGTTNEDTFLRDPTGNRRFWPVDCDITRATKNVFKDLTQYEVEQINAEALYIFKNEVEPLKGTTENWFEFSEEAFSQAQESRDRKFETDDRIGLFEWFIKLPIPEDWAQRDLYFKQGYARGEYKDYSGPTKRRNKICAAEINEVLLGAPANSTDKRTAREINITLGQIPWLEKTKNPIRYDEPYRKVRCFRVLWDKIPKEEGQHSN